jgi:hypothetical protein
MPVYQAILKTELNYKYNRHFLQEGQLLLSNEPVLTKFLSSHPNFREVTDENLLRLAPPIHAIKDPQDPYRMRKEDVINELVSYGIKVDVYAFSDALSSQLTMARKMMRRNFVTVLNEKGYPVYIDRLKMPAPVINAADANLSEPPEPQGDYYKVENVKQQEPVEAKPQKEKPLPENVVLMGEHIIDQRGTKGKDFSEFVLEKLDNEEADKAKQQQVAKLLFAEQEKRAEIKEWEKEKQIEAAGDDVNYFIKNKDINKQRFMYLLSYKTGQFMRKDVTQEQLKTIREVAIRSCSLDAAECLLRHYGITVEYLRDDTEKRVKCLEAFRKLHESLPPEKQELLNIEMNMLMYRLNEINKDEPDYKGITTKESKRALTRLTNEYGITTWYDEKYPVRRILMKAYEFLKIGLELPKTYEAINDELFRLKRMNKELFEEGYAPMVEYRQQSRAAKASKKVNEGTAAGNEDKGLESPKIEPVEGLVELPKKVDGLNG